MTTATLVETLRDELDGTLLIPGDEGWDLARRPWHPGVDQHPLAVVHVVSVDDVEHVVRVAARHGVAVAAQPRGHGATPALDGAILVRTGGLDELSVDVTARTARIGAGVMWGRVMAALDGTGLVALAGSSPGVTAVPYLLGGGLSWFGRSFGTGASSVRAVELVDASGERRRVDDETDPELMWALRGGGGDFALVTAVEVELFDAPELYGGRLVFPGEQAPAVLAAFRDLTAGAPAALTAFAEVMHFPPAPQLPEELRGQSFAMVDVVHVGSAEGAEALLAPVRAAGTVVRETVRVLAPSEVGTVAEEPEEAPGGGMVSAALVQPVSRLDAEMLRIVLERTGPRSGLAFTGFRHLGGALGDARVPGACATVASPYTFQVMGVAPGPEHLAGLTAAVADLRAALTPWHAQGSTLTFLPEDAPLSDAYDAPTIARLQEVKRRVDPAGTFRSNHPVLAG